MVERFDYHHTMSESLGQYSEGQFVYYSDYAKLAEALRGIAEGNLGDEPWQANYLRIRQVALAALSNIERVQRSEPAACSNEQRELPAEGKGWRLGEVQGRWGDNHGRGGEFRSATPPAPQPLEGAVKAAPNFSGWRSIDTAPEDQHVILGTSGGHVGEAIMLVDEDTGRQKWAWALGPLHPNHTPYGWQPLPSSLSAPVLSDLRDGGFDGPTGAE